MGKEKADQAPKKLSKREAENKWKAQLAEWSRKLHIKSKADHKQAEIDKAIARRTKESGIQTHIQEGNEGLAESKEFFKATHDTGQVQIPTSAEALGQMGNLTKKEETTLIGGTDKQWFNMKNTKTPQFYKSLAENVKKYKSLEKYIDTNLSLGDQSKIRFLMEVVIELDKKNDYSHKNWVNTLHVANAQKLEDIYGPNGLYNLMLSFDRALLSIKGTVTVADFEPTAGNPYPKYKGIKLETSSTHKTKAFRKTVWAGSDKADRLGRQGAVDKTRAKKKAESVQAQALKAREERLAELRDKKDEEIYADELFKRGLTRSPIVQTDTKVFSYSVQVEQGPKKPLLLVEHIAGDRSHFTYGSGKNTVDVGKTVEIKYDEKVNPADYSVDTWQATQAALTKERKTEVSEAEAKKINAEKVKQTKDNYLLARAALIVARANKFASAIKAAVADAKLADAGKLPEKATKASGAVKVELSADSQVQIEEVNMDKSLAALSKKFESFGVAVISPKPSKELDFEHKITIAGKEVLTMTVLVIPDPKGGGTDTTYAVHGAGNGDLKSFSSPEEALKQLTGMLTLIVAENETKKLIEEASKEHKSVGFEGVGSKNTTQRMYLMKGEKQVFTIGVRVTANGKAYYYPKSMEDKTTVVPVGYEDALKAMRAYVNSQLLVD